MRLLVSLAATAILATAAFAQVTMLRAPLQIVKPVQKVSVQSPKAVFLSETPEVCEARNKFLREKMTTALNAQLSQLQSEIADRRAHSYMCSAASASTSGSGAVTDCGVYACNSIDGMCRSSAKTSSDCAPGYLWDGFRSCVPAPR